MPHPAQPPGQRLLYWLAETAAARRVAAKITPERIADLAGVRAVTIDRFEKARNWPRDPERVIAAYAHLTGVKDPRDIYQAALDLWREHGTAPSLDGYGDASEEQAFAQEIEPPDGARDASAPSRTTSARKRRGGGS